METRGRKPSIYPQKEIDDIVYRFTQEEKVAGWIKYSEVYRFAKKLYENEKIKYKLSEDYWRREGRQGKETIDKANKLYETTFINKESKDIDVYIDTEECVNKFFTGKASDKKKLIQALKINEKKARNSNKLSMKIEDLKQGLFNEKEKSKKLEALVEQQQRILFSWYNASLKSEVPLINLVTTGKSRHPMVDLFFETAFTNSIEGYEKFEEYRGITKYNDEINDSNQNVVVPIRKNRLKQITEQYENKK
ncbi:hypothetical protein [Bacillus sp. MUM 13]|uniref:hypothetical protein n=1 Tax=Bacillus sp. MUM 13 TaxID=1678001 RepID=UPI0008F59EDB|nr:hypothetical protein [Bacillus sp. MUM 13]OIK11273.1 hypothetical protein BIV59_12850 [Bacillus sp. MUM 13]